MKCSTSSKKGHIVPSYVYDVIDAFPAGSHPMTIFSTAILTMHRESFFNRKYFRGLNKLDYWEPTYEDAIGLLAKLTEIATYIYTKLYKDGKTYYPIQTWIWAPILPG